MNGQLQIMILTGQLIFLGFLTLLLHRFSARLGLSPMIILLGGMIAVLQFRIFGVITLPQSGTASDLMPGLYVLLPPVLLGLLMIYIVNGSIQARYTLLGLILVVCLIAIFQCLLVLFGNAISSISHFAPLSVTPARTAIASAATLSLDMIVLIVIYQWVSNWRERYPSRFASGAALIAALFLEAMMNPLLVDLGTPNGVTYSAANITAVGLSALVIWAMAAFYIQRFSRRMPDSAAANPRPSLEIFSTQLQLEQRARLHYNLLRTTHRINQLVVRSTNRDELFQQTCELLTRQLDYDVAWIGLCNPGSSSIDEIVTKAGPKVGLLDRMSLLSPDLESGPDPTGTAIRSKKSVIHRIDKRNPVNKDWYRLIIENRLTAFAAFPMRLSDNVLGVMGVYSQLPRAFDEEEELSLLQQLADDLAYAMVSLEARRQQAFLHTSTETMRDGLLITDIEGAIIYANPAITEMLDSDLKDILGRSIFSFMTEQQVSYTIHDLLPALDQNRQVNIEVEIFDRHNRPFFAELTIAEVKTAQNQPSNFVVNLRDTTRRKIFEHRLLTLNRLTTELVQIHEPDKLYEMILQACEELLEADASAICFGLTLSEIESQLHARHVPGTLHFQLIAELSKREGESVIFEETIIAVERISDEPLEPGLKNQLEELGFQAFLLLPVQYQESPMGILGLYYHDPRDYDESTRQLGVTAAHTLAIALQNARLYQSEHSQRQYAEAIVQATETLNSTLDLDLVLSQILEQTYRVVPCNSVNLMLIENDQAVVVRQLHLTAEGEIESLPGGPVLHLTTPTLFRMLTTGQPILITDTYNEPDWKVLERSSWIRSYASAPLQIRQEVIGFLNVNSKEPNFFDEESLRRLQAFASHAAAALHNARLYGDLQEYSLLLEDRVDERTAQLSLAKERIEAILESVPDAVFVLDSSENLLESNQAGTLLLKQLENAGSKLFDPELMSRLRSSQTSDDQATIEATGRTYQALSSPLPFPDQQAGLVVVFRDVTRFQELDRMKTQFVSDVSHELRTPLANLSLFLDLLANEQDDQKRVRYQSTLRRETDRLTELIEDLLTISRLESNRINFYIKEIDVVPLIQDMVDDRSQMAVQRDLRLNFEEPSTLPDALADQRQLTQVLSNVLTNAFNYTPPGGQIRLAACCDQTNGMSWIKISISDNGYGIEPKELPDIFTRFFRGSASRKTSAPGTGLGLAISEEIMERMGGRITVDSQPGLGSTFTIWVQGVL